MPNLYRKHLELFQKDLQLHSSMSYPMENKEKIKMLQASQYALAIANPKEEAKPLYGLP